MVLHLQRCQEAGSALQSWGFAGWWLCALSTRACSEAACCSALSAFTLCFSPAMGPEPQNGCLCYGVKSASRHGRQQDGAEGPSVSG